MRGYTVVYCVVLAVLVGTVQPDKRLLRRWKRTPTSTTTATTAPTYRTTNGTTKYPRTTLPWYQRAVNSTTRPTAAYPWYWKTTTQTPSTTTARTWWNWPRTTRKQWNEGTTTTSRYDRWGNLRTSTPNYWYGHHRKTTTDFWNRWYRRTTTAFWDRWDKTKTTTNIWDVFNVTPPTTYFWDRWETTKKDDLFDFTFPTFKPSPERTVAPHYFDVDNNSSSYGSSTGVYIGVPAGFVLVFIILVWVLRIYLCSRRVTRTVTVVRRPTPFRVLSVSALTTPVAGQNDRERLIDTRHAEAGQC